MSSSSSSLLPISTEAASTLKTFLSRLSASLHRTLSKSRPWTELIDRTALSKPDSAANAASRIRKNFNYFRINYLTIIALALAISLISHPFSLITLVCMAAAWLFLYVLRPSDQPVAIMGREFSERETLGGLMLVSIVVVFLTSVGSLLMWSFMVGMGIVCVHGALRIPEDLFMDEQDVTGSSLFSAFTGNASSAAAAAVASSVASRV